jgi:hypothetical protein
VDASPFCRQRPPFDRRRVRPGWVRLAFAAVLIVLAVPATTSAETGVVAVGDFGRGGEPQRELGEAVEAFAADNRVDTLVTLGDNDYTDSPQAFARNWRESFGWVGAAGITVAGALGDHDVEGPDDGRWQYETLGMPGPYYSRRVGEIELFVLDASSRGRIAEEEQTAWLDRALQSSTAPWKVAIVHKPPYTCGRYRGSPEVLQQWVPLFERHGVRLVLSGDDHNYQRFGSRNGIVYVVHGGGNDRIYGLESCPTNYPPRLAASEERGFLYLRATAAVLEGSAISISGDRIDRFTLIAGPTYADSGDLGFEGLSFAGARRSASGSKPESKLWWNDGSWWGSLFDQESGDFHIFRLDLHTQRWVDTEIVLDTRVNSRADALWDGTHLYVASHIGSDTPEPGFPSLLFRFSYRSGGDGPGRYVLDRGFPVEINNSSSETLVIDEDSTGLLWATWVQDENVYVNRSSRGGRRWGRPFVLPVDGVEVGPDISSVVAFDGDKIGVFWGNHLTGRFYFAVHEDGDPAGVWQPVETIDLGTADDHVNVKAGSDGRVYAAVKTATRNLSAALVALLVRDPATATWSVRPFGTFDQGHTRPIVLLDEEHDEVRMYATGPLPPEREGVILEKVAAMADQALPSGSGRPVILDADQPDVSDASSTKQPLSSRTGLVVLASNNVSSIYWHYYDPLDMPSAVIAVAEGFEADAAAAAASPAGPSSSGSMTFAEIIKDARGALIVAFGIPAWLLAVAAVRFRRNPALLSGYIFAAMAGAAAVTLSLAALFL